MRVGKDTGRIAIAQYTLYHGKMSELVRRTLAFVSPANDHSYQQVTRFPFLQACSITVSGGRQADAASIYTTCTVSSGRRALCGTKWLQCGSCHRVFLDKMVCWLREASRMCDVSSDITGRRVHATSKKAQSTMTTVRVLFVTKNHVVLLRFTRNSQAALAVTKEIDENARS
jgi:hypothetical protein